VRLRAPAAALRVTVRVACTRPQYTTTTTITSRGKATTTTTTTTAKKNATQLLVVGEGGVELMEGL